MFKFSKNKKRGILFLSFLALFFLSCQSNESSKKLITEIPDSGSLLSKELTLDSAVLIPSKILLFPDKAVIFDNGKEALFKVYSLPDLTFLYSFGKLGEGPDEFRTVSINSLQTLENDLVVVSGTQLRKIRLEKDSSVMGESIELLMSNSAPVNRLLLINDSIYICDIFDAKPGGPEHQMVHLQRAEEVATFGKYPEKPKSENMDQGGLYRNFGKTTVVNPEDGMVGAFYFLQNQIKFYSHQGELLQEIELETPTKNVSEEEMNMFWVEPFATAAHIYVMYLGVPKSEVMEQSDTFRPHLETWDWEGNLLERFRLDQLITTFAVSEKFQKMYGFSYFKEGVLFEYDLKEGGKEGVILGYGKNEKQKKLSTDNDKNPKKQVQTANPIKKIIAENDYYRMELPMGWNYLPSSLEVKNELGERDGFYLNGATFRSEKPEGKSFCGDASVQVRIAFPKEEAFDFEEYLKSEADEYRSNTNLDALSIKELDTENGSKGYRINYSNQLVDPKGNKYIFYSEVDIFERENRIIRTSFSSCNLFKHYYEEVQEAFASLTLKDGFP